MDRPSIRQTLRQQQQQKQQQQQQHCARVRMMLNSVDLEEAEREMEAVKARIRQVCDSNEKRAGSTPGRYRRSRSFTNPEHKTSSAGSDGNERGARQGSNLIRRVRTPSCVQDITEEWLLYVMQQYYEQNFNQTITRINAFSVEEAGGQTTNNNLNINNNNNSKKIGIMTEYEEQKQKKDSNEDNERKDSLSPPDNDGAVAGTTAADNGSSSSTSRHILSEAFRVMVDVPDPPRNANGLMMSSSLAKTRIHNLFVKIPPKRNAKFERMVRRNRTLEHEVKVYSELLRDLQNFVKTRVGDTIKLKIPTLYHSQEDAANANHVLVIEDLAKEGFKARDWFKHKLTHDEVILAVDELATFHACGLAYRMSLKEEIDEKYPYLEDDLYTSNMAKELLAKYLDSFLHFLSLLPGIQEHVLKLRKISHEVFQLLVKLRRPSDPLGTRFNTICHGDMWMGNLLFKDQPEESGNGSSSSTSDNEEQPKKPSECVIIDFHSAQFLSPATDLAHLLLTSTTREYRKKHWDEIVQKYYDTFNRTLAEFGLILRHLGTTYNDFLYEVKRALSGQFLCVAFIIPIVIYCGPSEWRIERRRGSSVDRKNTVRHLIQMMAISEEDHTSSHSGSNNPSSAPLPCGSLPSLNSIPLEFQPLYKDEELTQNLIDLIHTAADLDILEFEEFCKNIGKPRPLWNKTKATTGKHIPVY